MTAGRLRMAAWVMPALTAAVWLAAFAPPLARHRTALDDLQWGVPFVALAVVGAVVIQRQPANRVGWVLCGIGLAMGLAALHIDGLRLLYASPGWRRTVPWLVAVQPFDLAGWGLIFALLLTFPDGHLPSRGWKWVLVLLCLFLGLVGVDQAITPVQQTSGLPVSALARPDLARVLDPVTSFNVNGLVLLASAAGLAVRYRSGSAVTRVQIKWFGVSVAVLVLCAIVGGAVNALTGRDDVQNIFESVGLLCFAAGIGVAVVRHRLYDVDLVISRGLAYGALTVMVTLLYVGLVVGVGDLVGRPAGANLSLSIIATALVAVAFHPLKVRLLDLSNRLVYGRRQTPYESLAGFTRRLAEDYTGDGILQRMIDTLAEGVRASVAAVYLVQSDARTVAATSPPGAVTPSREPDRSVEVRHQGERLGSLAVWTEDGHALNSTELRLLFDLAVQAGLVLHNERLTAELERRLEQLRVSRRRLVAAQDAERRRLERDLHDGAQHDLVALRMKLGLAEGEAAASGSRLAPLLIEIRAETAAALENIRQLSRGLYPPLLESQGLVAALTAHARRLPIQVDVRASAERFPREIETAVYFCCIEALQNVVKHAEAGRAWIVIESLNDSLHFEVGDDGDGFDAGAARGGAGLNNIADRIEALGGSLRIASGPAGTVIAGTLEIGSRAPARRGAAS